jgi:protein-tyrosine kinase
MAVRFNQGKQQGASAKAGSTGNRQQGDGSNNVIRLSRTPRIEIQPDALARQGILAPGVAGSGQMLSACKALGTLVTRFGKRHKLDSLLVAAPAGGTGTTVTAINLAFQLTRQVNRTVLLVDLNLRRPALHHYFGYQPAYGIAECIRGEVPLKKILFSPVERLTVAPSTRPESDADALLSNPSAGRLVQEMVSRYRERLVIFDCPPVLEWDDIAALLPEIDASLLVVKAGRTRLDQAQQALAYLQDATNIGVVLNTAPRA